MPVSFVIFGVTGDLAGSKLIPALFRLYQKGLLPKKFKIFGYSRRDFTDNEFRSYVTTLLPKNDETFLSHIHYVQGQFDQKEDYERLKKVLAKVDEEELDGCSDKLFYLSVPPEWYLTVSNNLSNVGLSVPCGGKDGWARLLIEKPFGEDLDSAEKLNKDLLAYFKDEQIFRIDHYLAKETSMDILHFRFEKGEMEDIWNSDNIEKIEIELLEKEGVKNRGSFYDKVGALRDVGQNHLLEMLALVTMEEPLDNSAQSIQSARENALASIQPLSPSKIASIKRAQYDGYREERGIAADSKTETYFDLTLHLDNPRWEGVEFRLRSGKKMPENKVEIAVHFKDGRKTIFDYRKPQQMEAYENVFLYASKGDGRIFTSFKEVEAEWQSITPILQKWQKLPLSSYPLTSIMELK